MENPAVTAVKSALDWKFILKIFVAFWLVMIAVDIVAAFLYPEATAIVFRPFSWAKAKFFPAKLETAAS